MDVDLLALRKGTKLHSLRGNECLEEGSSKHPIVVVQGLRNPCPQIEKFRAGLKEAFVVREEEGACGEEGGGDGDGGGWGWWRLK